MVLSFDLFNLPDSKNCTDDYVEIHRVRYCGSKKPATITSEGSDMHVKFESSGKSRYPGFKASYTSKSEYSLNHCSSLLIMQFLIKSHIVKTTAIYHDKLHFHIITKIKNNRFV